MKLSSWLCTARINIHLTDSTEVQMNCTIQEGDKTVLLKNLISVTAHAIPRKPLILLSKKINIYAASQKLHYSSS